MFHLYDCTGKHVLVLALVLCLMAARLFGELIVYEGFNYLEVYQGLNGKNGGSGWSTSWYDSGSPKGFTLTNVINQIYGNLTTSGNSASASAGAAYANRSFTPAITDGVAWISFLGERDPSITYGGYPGFAFSHYYLNYTGDLSNKFWIGGPNPSASAWSLRFNPNQQTHTNALTSALVGARRFVVARIDLTQTMAHLWIDPSTVSEPSLSTANASVTNTGYNASFDTVRWYGGNSTGGRLFADELRIGRTYADVTPRTTAPSAHVTDFFGTHDADKILLGWALTTTAQGYLIKGSDISFAAITAPVNATPETDQIDFSTGAVRKNLPSTDESFSGWSGLSGATHYYFKIYPYNNTGADILYNTSSVPQVEVAPEPGLACVAALLLLLPRLRCT